MKLTLIVVIRAVCKHYPMLSVHVVRTTPTSRNNSLGQLAVDMMMQRNLTKHLQPNRNRLCLEY